MHSRRNSGSLLHATAVSGSRTASSTLYAPRRTAAIRPREVALEDSTTYNERPYGLVLFAWAYIILGTFILVEAVTGLASPAPIEEGASPPSIYALLLFLFLGPAFVVAGAGIRAYRRWGRTLAIVLSIVTAGLSLYALIFVGLNLPWGVLLALVSIGYLSRRQVRRAFGLR